MRVRAEFDRRAAADPAPDLWVRSPAGGVERLMLDRIGGEVARATSLVRFAPGSAFPAHLHGGGEEFLVLEGVFEDETGAFAAGSYVRNPAGTRHAPASGPGCVLFVKLWQFASDDRKLVIRRAFETPLARVPGRDGVEVAVLHRHGSEEVRVERWAPGARVALACPDGLEVLCLEGGFAEGGERFGRWSWLRLPPGSRLDAETGGEGAFVWLKAGHLRDIRLPPGVAAAEV
jgi:anti-sigma factor ChrR (cupin superfamily)